jgi:hypothetical protein
VSVIADPKKSDIKNRTAFFTLMDKVGDMYLNGLLLSVMDHPNFLSLLDIIMFKGYSFLLKMALKTTFKLQPKADKMAKTEIA